MKAAVKNSKRAFTLVELVVVIAVLAIVAGIAVPTVAALVGSANKSSGEEQARMLNENCQLVYSEVKLGTINNTESKNSDGSAVTFAEPKNSNYSARNTAANTATIANVKSYAGLQSINCDNFYYCSSALGTVQYSKGTIYYTEDGNLPNVAGCSFIKLNDSTVLGTLS